MTVKIMLWCISVPLSQTAQTVLLVVAAFLICWMPHHIIAMWVEFGSFPLNDASFAFRISSHCLAYGNSCVNPILYAFLSENFRKACQQVFTCHFFYPPPPVEKVVRIRMENFSTTHSTTNIWDSKAATIYARFRDKRLKKKKRILVAVTLFWGWSRNLIYRDSEWQGHNEVRGGISVLIFLSQFDFWNSLYIQESRAQMCTLMLWSILHVFNIFKYSSWWSLDLGRSFQTLQKINLNEYDDDKKN